jgi:protein gp37
MRKAHWHKFQILTKRHDRFAELAGRLAAQRMDGRDDREPPVRSSCRRAQRACLRESCAREGVAFFFKQWGGHRPKSNGRELDGRHWDEYPQPAVRHSQRTAA